MSEEGAFGEAAIERFGWMKVSIAWPGRDLEVETRFYGFSTRQTFLGSRDTSSGQGEFRTQRNAHTRCERRKGD